MKRIWKILVIMVFVLSVIFCTSINTVKADENLAFEKDEFVFDKYYESTFFKMKVPSGYSLKDIKFKSENESIVTVNNYADLFDEDENSFSMETKGKVYRRNNGKSMD